MSSKDTKPALAPALTAVQGDGKAKAPRATSAAKIAVVTAEGGASDDLDLDASAPKAETIKMKDLLAAVVTKTGAKKKDAKDVVDAALAEIASALAAGKALSLPPLGNLRVAKTMEKGGATMMVLRLRLGGGEAAKGAKQALADSDEDS